MRAEKCAKLCSHFPDTGGEMPLQGLLVVSVFNSFDYLIFNKIAVNLISSFHEPCMQTLS